MFFISHRGNIYSADKINENHPDYINNALNLGYDVEVDIRFFKSKIYLGHDEPQFLIDEKFLKNKKIWCHAKDIDAALFLKKHNFNYFYHENDQITLTSSGFFWTYPGKKLTSNSICVLPETSNEEQNLKNCAGICSDYIEKYKKNYD